MNRSVMIVAGGTGGHVYPGIAVAQCLRERGVDLHWMGTRHGLEARVVPAQGFAFDTIPVVGLRGTGWLRRLWSPAMLLIALLAAMATMLRVRPGVVLGMGGFVSGPGGLAAWLCRRPLVIHEQNAIPGLTNRILSRIARRVLEAVPGSFSKAANAIDTGNPVRQEIAQMAAPGARRAAAEQPHVLVFGGSRGARALNEIVPVALSEANLDGLRITHQCGTDAVDQTRARYAPTCDVTVVPFIDDMAAAYAGADLVIARAGALTIAEIAACGVASVLVPFPYAVDDHQTANAGFLVAAGAAVLVPEKELTAAALAALVSDLIAAPEKLTQMAAAARTLARSDAAERVAGHCLEYVDA